MTDTLDLPLVIEPEALESLRGHPDLLIIDLSNPDNYRQAHVPGAIFVPFQHTLRGVPPAVGALPNEEQLTQLLSAIGLTENKWVVVYDDEGGGWAGRFIWLLDSVGHSRYSYLNGGIHAWLAAQLPISQEATQPQASEYQASITEAPSVTKEYLLDNHTRDDLMVWDARSPEEYAGLRANAQKAGHIPGAANFEWTRAMDRHNHLKIRDRDELMAELEVLGITRDKEIITHCQTHHRSGFTYLLGKVLGFNIKAYPGSWGEWGNDPDTPVEMPV